MNPNKKEEEEEEEEEETHERRRNASLSLSFLQKTKDHHVPIRRRGWSFVV
tara:strand:+ start:1589 stop:1741 length:153 start_codon:yes stop_codon:yes gene_type:complete